MEEVKQCTLLDLLMGLRGTESEAIQKTAWKQEEKKAFVQQNRAGIMSAFIKSMRMQLTKQAVFYGAVLLQGGQPVPYVCRRLLIDACEDGVDPVVIEYVTDLFGKAKKATYVDVLKGAVAICSGDNWWNCNYGRMKNKLFLTSKNAPTPEESSISVLMAEMNRLVMAGGFENAKASSAVLRRLREVKHNPDEYHAWLTATCIAKGRQTNDVALARVGEVAASVLNAKTGFSDGNWQLVLRYMACMGSNPAPRLTMESLKATVDQSTAMIEKILLVADERIISDEKIELPAWAFDGMHASNKKLYPVPDRRFPGTPQGFYNCELMVRKYGKLDPRNQAELDGCMVPDEYLRLFNEWLEEVEV